MNSIYAILVRQCENPSGLWGFIAAIIMNYTHRELHEWGLKYLSISENDILLDVCCGDGALIKKVNQNIILKKTIGIDKSPLMISIAKLLNRNLIESGNVVISLDNISKMSLRRESINVVTAFECIYFLDNIKKVFELVFSILKKEGKLLIVNEVYENQSYFDICNKWKIAMDIKIYSPQKIAQILEISGFSKVDYFFNDRNSWVAWLATK